MGLFDSRNDAAVSSLAQHDDGNTRVMQRSIMSGGRGHRFSQQTVTGTVRMQGAPCENSSITPHAVQSVRLFSSYRGNNQGLRLVDGRCDRTAEVDVIGGSHDKLLDALAVSAHCTLPPLPWSRALHLPSKLNYNSDFYPCIKSLTIRLHLQMSLDSLY